MKQLTIPLLCCCFLLPNWGVAQKNWLKKRANKKSAIQEEKIIPTNDTLVLVLQDSIAQQQVRFDSLLVVNKGLQDSLQSLNEKFIELSNSRPDYQPDIGTIVSSTVIDTGIIFEHFHYQGVSLQAIIVDDPKRVQLYHRDKKGKLINDFSRLNTILKKQKQELLFAVNAGMFEPDRNPVGLYIEEGNEQFPLNTTTTKRGNFYLLPNGVFSIDSLGQALVRQTESYPDTLSGIRYATQSGPMLVIDGKIHPKFVQCSQNFNIRNGVGVDARGRVIFLIARNPINLYNFAYLYLQRYHCDNALYLDGAISKMYLPNASVPTRPLNFGPLIGITREN